VRENIEFKVHLACDDETGRWYIAESDIPGLRLEADDPFALIERIKDAAPELIELNYEEIAAACAAGADAECAIKDRRELRPTFFPVFDSPLALATA
jgi:hypothetical protein